ncbi:MAG: hypothetical protein SVT56_12645 [Chloroflexota bacterium]|jgi:hypothetical protein|nr:hypothetical protein [Chloroflexota bacterium]
MSKIIRTGEITNQSADEVYLASVAAFEAVGFEVWKKRPLAWLSLARKKIDGVEISANFAARPSSPVSYTLTMTAGGLSEETLNEFVDQVIEQFQMGFSE